MKTDSRVNEKKGLPAVEAEILKSPWLKTNGPGRKNNYNSNYECPCTHDFSHFHKMWLIVKKRLFHQAVEMHTSNSSSGEAEASLGHTDKLKKQKSGKQKQKTNKKPPKQKIKDKQLLWGLRRKKLCLSLLK